MQLPESTNATELQLPVSLNRSGLFPRKQKHQRFYSINGEDEKISKLKQLRYAAVRFRKSLEKKFDPIRSNKYVRKIVKFVNPIFTRVTIALIWFALVCAIAIPSGEEHAFTDQWSNFSDLSINQTNHILNSTTVNISDTSGTYSLTLVAPPNSEHISAVFHKNDEEISSLSYRIDNLRNGDQISNGLLADISMDPYSMVSLCLLIMFSAVMGYLFKLIWMPPLLGMMLAGIIYTHVTFKWGTLPVIPRSLTSTLRSIALVVILSRGGLGISPSKLRARTFEIFRLATIPCLGESLVVAIACFFIVGISKDYWCWAAMAGCTVAAVSPAVVLPPMLQLQEKRYGIKKGIPTMIIAASSFDDVISISLFFIFLTLAYSTTDLAFTILRGPLELSLGLTYGILVGIVGRYISLGAKTSSVNRNRVMFLLGASLLVLIGSKKVLVHGSSLGGAGALGVVSSALFCSLSWKENKQPVEVSFKIIWQFAQPTLFGVIGYEINFLKEGFDGILIAKLVTVIIIGLMARSLLAFLSVACTRDLLLREKLFIPIAWLPKATVQAAIGSVALDAARNEDQIYYSNVVLYIAVFSILITAPIGAILINLTGTRLIQRDEPFENQDGKKSLKSIETAITDVSESSKDSNSPLGVKHNITVALQNGEIQVNTEQNSTS